MGEAIEAGRAIEIMEIRARHDRNRLLGTYDPGCGVLRLFHRGGIVTIKLPPATPPGPNIQPVDVMLNVE